MKLIGWTLKEGRIPGQHVPPDPSMSDVIAAIEAIHVDMRNPYVILASPEVDGKCPDYCQKLAVVDSAYRCEIRLFGNSPHEYRHW